MYCNSSQDIINFIGRQLYNDVLDNRKERLLGVYN